MNIVVHVLASTMLLSTILCPMEKGDPNRFIATKKETIDWIETSFERLQGNRKRCEDLKQKWGMRKNEILLKKEANDRELVGMDAIIAAIDKIESEPSEGK